MSDNQPAAKVLFRVPNTEGGCDVETLWAYDLGNDHYCLDNSPFYATQSPGRISSMLLTMKRKVSRPFNVSSPSLEIARYGLSLALESKKATNLI